MGGLPAAAGANQPDAHAPAPARLDRRHWLVLGALLATFSYVYWTQKTDETSVAAIKAHGDGIYYYAWLRSLVFDRDLDFKNDYRLLGDPFSMERTKKDRLMNPFAIGSAILWVPSLCAAQVSIGAGNLLGLWTDSLDGTTVRYQRVVFYGTLLWAIFGLALIALAALRYSDPNTAALTVAALALATPLSWYMIRQASFSHALDAFAVAALVCCWLRGLFARSLWSWAAVGALVGLATLVRTQGLGHAVLPLGEWLVLAVIALRRRNGRELARLALAGLLCALAAAIVLLPQALAWDALYGKWMLVPQGETFMFWGDSKWVEALYSSRNGLFAWSPLLQLGLLGLVLMVIRPRGPHARAVGILSLLAIAIQAYLNGAALDWWAGWAFGGRRFLGCTVYFGVGLASLIAAVGPILVRTTRALAPAVPALVCALFAIFNLNLMDDYLKARAERASAQSMSKLWSGALTRGVEKLYKLTGNLGSIPASLVFGLRAGVSPARYDLTSGTELVDDVVSARVSARDERFAMGGFGEPTVFRGKTCRWVASRSATYVIPLRKAVPLGGNLELHPASSGTRFRLRLRGRTILDEKLAVSWKSYPFKIPVEAVRAGLNYLAIELESPRGESYPIGKTGRQSRLEVQVESSAYHVGNRAAFHFGQTSVKILRRGVVVYVFERDGTGFARLGIFDSYRIPEETARFADVIRHLPDGAGVAIAVKDEASARWSEEGDQALRSVGGKESLRKRYRHSYALIGVKGARPGQAIELIDGQKSVRAVLGRPIEERGTGVAWGELVLTRPPDPKKK